MMKSRMRVVLTDEELGALKKLCGRERRMPQEQAAVLIRQGLEQAGMLLPQNDDGLLIRYRFTGEEAAALNEMCLQDKRRPNDQARYVLRQELIRLGLLDGDKA